MRAARTLVVAPNWVGDNVMAIPVLESLSNSGRSLAVLAKPHLEPLLRLVPGVDEVILRNQRDRETIRTLKDQNFEEAVILPNSFHSAWLAFRAAIPVRWGYRSDLRTPLLEPAVGRPSGLRHQIADYDVLLERLGAAIPSAPPRLTPADRLLSAADQILTGTGVDDRSKLVGVFPGAEFGPSKRWPSESFAKLLRQLSRTPRLRPVIIAGPGEEALAESVRLGAVSAPGQVPQAPIIGPDLDLGELAGVLARLDVLVTNDSGPMHIAAATGTPCVVLFGPTNPIRTAPAGEELRVLYTNRWCSPCFKKRCPLLHQRCLRDIEVGRVMAAVGEVLEQP